MFGSIYFIVLLRFLHCSPQQSEENLRIHHGIRSNESFVLHLRESNGTRGYICTASLIRPQIILTAGHCITPGYDKKTVTYGCSDLDSKTCKIVPVVDWKVHPNYAAPATHSIRTDYADLAVAKLKYELKDIKPISLPTGNNTNWIPSGNAYLVGFGRTENRTKTGVQYATHLTIMDDHKPSNSTEKIFVKSTGSRTDGGDSGGPLIINQTIYGVLSGGNVVNNITKTRIYSDYMSVNHYRKFIDTAIMNFEKK